MKLHFLYISLVFCFPILQAKNQVSRTGAAPSAEQLIEQTQAFLATPQAREWEDGLAELQKKDIERQLNGKGNLYKAAQQENVAAIQKILDDIGITEPVFIVAMKKKNPLKGKFLAGAQMGRVIVLDEESAQSMSDHIKQHVYRHEATHIKYKDPLMDLVAEAIICTQKESPSPNEIVRELNNNQKRTQKRAVRILGKKQLNKLMRELELFRERRAEEEAARLTNCPACTLALANYMRQFETTSIEHTKKQLHRRSNSGYFSSKDFMRIAREQSQLCNEHLHA